MSKNSRDNVGVAPILEVDPQHPQPRAVRRAVELLEAGACIAYPTDTAYALGCDVHNKRAVDMLYALKREDRKKPFTFLCADLAHVSEYAKVSTFAYRALRHYTPGPFTFVMEATRLVPELLQSKQREVGIRVPIAPLAIAIIQQLGRPLATTSASFGDEGTFTDARTIKQHFGDYLALILDGGTCPEEQSTVVSLVNDEIQVLRQGKGIIPA